MGPGAESTHRMSATEGSKPAKFRLVGIKPAAAFMGGEVRGVRMHMGLSLPEYAIVASLHPCPRWHWQVDALVYEPIPYRSAIAAGCSHGERQPQQAAVGDSKPSMSAMNSSSIGNDFLFQVPMSRRSRIAS